MAITDYTRKALQVGLADKQAGDEIADALDAGSATLSDRTKRALEIAMVVNPLDPDDSDLDVAGKIDAGGGALTGAQQNALATAIADRIAAQEIDTVLTP